MSIQKIVFDINRKTPLILTKKTLAKGRKKEP